MIVSEHDTLLFLAEKVGHGFKWMTLLHELREADDFEPICPECGRVCSCENKQSPEERHG